MSDDQQQDSKMLEVERALLQYAIARLAERQHGGTTVKLNENTGKPAANAEAQRLQSEVRDLPLKASSSGPHWLITLAVGDEAGTVIRVKVKGDVALGVARPPHPLPDLDLGMLQAAEQGVSRRHAVLRPALDALYLIPLKSTNGTRINDKRIPTGSAVALTSGDVISLGGLSLALTIDAKPEELRAG